MTDQGLQSQDTTAGINQSRSSQMQICYIVNAYKLDPRAVHIYICCL